MTITPITNHPEPDRSAPDPTTPDTTGPDTTAPSHTAGPPTSRGNPTQSPTAHNWVAAGYLILAIILALVDVILIKAIFNAILKGESYESYALAIVTAAGATLLAWFSGQNAAIADVDRLPAHRRLAVLLASGWAALGASLTYLRWNTSEFTNTDTRFEGDPTTDTAAGDPHHILAITLLAMYLLPGFLAFAHGYITGNPLAARARDTYQRLLELRERLPHERARVLELSKLLTRHENELARARARARNARHQADDLAEELHAFAAAEIARRLAHPWAVPPATNTPHTHTDETTGDSDSGEDTPRGEDTTA